MHFGDINKTVFSIISSLEEAGYSAYIVGGALRDWIMGKSQEDFDLATSAAPDEVKKIFKDDCILDTGLSHGSLTLVRGEFRAEITTYRMDGVYEDKRHPKEVKFVSSIREDLARRDFTMNAMAFSPDRGLVDPYGGVRDIEEGIIRCVGDPERRFEEDGLRILRAVRFASVTGFKIEERTGEALRSKLSGLDMVSAERKRDEFIKMVSGRYAGDVIKEFPEVIAALMPELSTCQNSGSDKSYSPYGPDVYENMRLSLSRVPGNLWVRLAVIFDHLAKAKILALREQVRKQTGEVPEEITAAELVAGVMKRLKFSRKTTEHILCLIKHRDAPVRADNISVKRLLNTVGRDAFFDLIAFQKAESPVHNCKAQDRYGEKAKREGSAKYEELDRTKSIGRRLIGEGACFSLESLKVNGRDLIEAGFEEGRSLGLVMDILLDEVIEEKLPNEKKELLKRAESLRPEFIKTVEKEN